MSSSPAYDIQVALSAALLGEATITAMVGQNVFDDIAAPNSPYPRICIGDEQILGRANGFTAPSEVYETLHVWANGPTGRQLAKRIGGALRDFLAPQPASGTPQPLTIDGHTVTSVLLHDERYMTQTDPDDPNALVGHGVLTFYYRTVPQPT